ncbi:hypothetical protein DP116_18105 [Brasilonema bromeliae SPC951]|uniref:Uncharacterized protein n=1 Tax=Brasilonema bromeliae SPC951 TaxID=385972 RepID=A0ABX1PAD5_9CYAN|nr:hypothetical protein [Brasilonema bromeliae SPC951]
MTGNREQGTGNREQGTGNREQGTGNREKGVCFIHNWWRAASGTFLGKSMTLHIKTFSSIPQKSYFFDSKVIFEVIH